MSYFTEDTISFWRGLIANNSKAWFDAHRGDYGQFLRAPYLALAEDLCTAVRLGEPEYEVEPKKTVYRINRDTRFSKDKSPYKSELGITIGRSQKHDTTWPAYTVRLSPERVTVAGGLYAPEPPLRDHVRRQLAEHPQQIAAVAADPEFVKFFSTVQGEKHKRLPKDLGALATSQPLVYHKQWVFWGEMEDPDALVDPDLDHQILTCWSVGRKLNEALKSAITNPVS